MIATDQLGAISFYQSQFVVDYAAPFTAVKSQQIYCIIPPLLFFSNCINKNEVNKIPKKDHN